MAQVKPLEIRNEQETVIVQLERFQFFVYVCQGKGYPWMPVEVDTSIAKRALKVIHDAPKTMKFKRKMHVRNGAIDNLILAACPEESKEPWFVLKFRTALLK